jgi:mannosyl-3-phosphoglycerate phosphatase
MPNGKKPVLFSDLDGTLLDRDTYSFSGAEEALCRIADLDVPLVLATSKTRSEVELYRQRLSNKQPFIVENGAAAFIPAGYFSQLPSSLSRTGDYFVIELGVPRTAIRKVLDILKERIPVPLRGFGDLTPEEIAGISNLGVEEAKLSMMREYTEPFIPDETLTDDLLAQIRETTREFGLKLTVGEKFVHLSGPHSKGELVRRLIALFKDTLGDVLTVALGDGKNDIEMLTECQVAVVMKKKSGLLDEDVLRSVPGAHTFEAGPAGWNKAVIEVIEGRLI